MSIRFWEGQRQIWVFFGGKYNPYWEWTQKLVLRATAAGTGRGNNGREESGWDMEQEGSLQITTVLPCGLKMKLVSHASEAQEPWPELSGRQAEAPNKEENSPGAAAHKSAAQGGCKLPIPRAFKSGRIHASSKACCRRDSSLK